MTVEQLLNNPWYKVKVMNKRSGSNYFISKRDAVTKDDIMFVTRHLIGSIIKYCFPSIEFYDNKIKINRPSDKLLVITILSKDNKEILRYEKDNTVKNPKHYFYFKQNRVNVCLWSKTLNELIKEFHRGYDILC